MAADTTRTPLPPRWFIRTAWVAHRGLYRVTRGRMGLRRASATKWGMMRLRTIGRRSGAAAWWLNLQAHPDATVELVDGPHAVRARAVEGDERTRLWARWAEYDKGLDGYAARRSRQTAVVVLEPVPQPFRP